jgi:hypothetical protein
MPTNEALQDNSMQEMREIKEWSINDMIKFAVLQTLKAMSEDTHKFSICVNAIESLMCDEVEENEDYKKKINKKWEELEEEYGNRFDKKIDKVSEFANFKFRLLVKLMKSKIPVEITGEV